MMCNHTGTSFETGPDVPASQKQRRPRLWAAETEGEEGVGDNTEEKRCLFQAGTLQIFCTTEAGWQNRQGGETRQG